MFSSNNSNSRENSQNYPTQWALNPSAYQNVSNEQVDWAALAQQWIMMKESAPPDHHSTKPKEILNEGGEAPMDVENEKDDINEQWSESNDGSTTGVQDTWNNWQQWGTWPGNWTEPPPPGSVLPQTTTVSSINKTALLPTPFTHYGPPGSDVTNTDYQTYEGSASTPGEFISGGQQGPYWSSSGPEGRGKHPIKGNRMPRKGFPPPDIRPPPISTESVTLDAAKRRQLPAWIREGLEKMEREKQKQLDKERERIEREEYLSRKKEEKKDALELLRSADGSVLPPKSKFDSDSGDSGSEERSSRQSQSKNRRKELSRSDSPPVPLTDEERMLWVRRTMTEVLLQVTSSEIETICQEELNRLRSRTPAKKGGRPAAIGAGPSAVGSLGLGMYGGESSDSDSDTEASVEKITSNEKQQRSTNHLDGEEINSNNSKRHQQSKDNNRRRNSDSSRRENTDSRVEQEPPSDSSNADGGSDSQVDTTRSHGNSNQSKHRDRDRSRNHERERRHRSPSSSPDSSSSVSQSSSSEHSKKKKKNKQPKKKPPSKRHRTSSTSRSEEDNYSSDTKSSTSKSRSRDKIKRKSRSVTPETSRKHSSTNRERTNHDRSRRSRSVSLNRSRTRRDRSISHSRSRSRSRRSNRRRTTRSRTRSRDRRYDRDRRRSHSRSRDRDRDHRRDSYRSSRRRTKTRSRSRSGGGKRRGY